MRTNCDKCKGLVTVGYDGLVGDHPDPLTVHMQEPSDCDRSGKTFPGWINSRVEDCPKCDDKDVILKSNGDMLKHYDVGDVECEYSHHNYDELTKPYTLFPGVKL